jgi:hypothetical protein
MSELALLFAVTVATVGSIGVMYVFCHAFDVIDEFFEEEKLNESDDNKVK